MQSQSPPRPEPAESSFRPIYHETSPSARRALMAHSIAPTVAMFCVVATMYAEDTIALHAAFGALAVMGLACGFILALSHFDFARRHGPNRYSSVCTYVASLALLVSSTLAEPAGRNLLLLLLPIPFLFCTLRLGVRRLFQHAVGVSLLALAFSVALPLLRGQSVNDTGLGSVLLAVSLMLLMMSFVSGQTNERRRSFRRELAASHAVLMHLTDAVVKVSARHTIDLANPGLQLLMRWPAGHRADGHVDTVLRLQDGHRFSTVLDECEAEFGADVRAGIVPESWSRVRSLRLELDDGAVRDVDVTLVAQLRNARALDGFVVVIRDVSEARQQLAELRHAANSDVGTGLSNRRGFLGHLQEVARHSAASLRSYWVFVIDLDQFKIVNDACGHEAGDDLLRMVADQVHPVIPPGGLLARLGGDEFGIIASGIDALQAESLGHHVMRRIGDIRFVRDGRHFRISASIGIALGTPDETMPEMVLTRADSACFLAKSQGRGRVQVYQIGDDEVARHRTDLGWVGRIQDALNNDRFMLFGQRIVALGDDPRGRVSVEVLLRMIGEHGEAIAPGAFLPAAERFNLISLIDRHVIRMAARAMSIAVRQHGELPVVSINLSASSLREPGLLQFIEDVIVGHELPFDRFVFELTESATVHDLGQARVFFNGVRQLGARVALDDVGSGFNSFMQMRELPLDQIKLDGTYVRTVCDNPVDRVFVETLQRIAGVLGVETVAEFVENDLIAASMAQIGVNHVQGFGIHRPEPLELTLVPEQAHATAQGLDDMLARLRPDGAPPCASVAQPAGAAGAAGSVVMAGVAGAAGAADAAAGSGAAQTTLAPAQPCADRAGGAAAPAGDGAGEGAGTVAAGQGAADAQTGPRAATATDPDDDFDDGIDPGTDATSAARSRAVLRAQGLPAQMRAESIFG